MAFYSQRALCTARVVHQIEKTLPFSNIKVFNSGKVVISKDYHILLVKLQNSEQNNPDEHKLHRNGFDLHVTTASFRINHKYAGLCIIWINVLIQQSMCMFNCSSKLRLGVNCLDN